MGSGMAANLQRFLQKNEKPSLIYYNRTISKGDDIKELGGVAALSVIDLASKSDLVFICVSSIKRDICLRFANCLAR